MNTVLFKFLAEDLELADQEQTLDLMRSFNDNGQVIEYFQHPVIKGNVIEYNGIIIEPDALNEKYFNVNTVKLLNSLKEVDKIDFSYEITSNGVTNVEKDISSISDFILYRRGCSPISSMDNFHDVPLYLLPPTSIDGTNYFNIICWERDYEAIDRLWFRGSIDEDYYFNQLTDYKSHLNQNGIDICKQISELTKKGCYYYLYHYPGEVEKLGSCPQCGNSWKLEELLFDVFEYKCTNCFLIS
jgi:predicted  nucleic acid-binding Zn ribbon protein